MNTVMFLLLIYFDGSNHRLWLLKMNSSEVEGFCHRVRTRKGCLPLTDNASLHSTLWNSVSSGVPCVLRYASLWSVTVPTSMMPIPVKKNTAPSVPSSSEAPHSEKKP